jgi:hypothetical protein
MTDRTKDEGMTAEQMALLAAGQFEVHDYVDINYGGNLPNGHDADYRTYETPHYTIRELATALTAATARLAEVESHQAKTTAAWRRAEERVHVQSIEIERLGQKIADYVSEVAYQRDRLAALQAELDTHCDCRFIDGTGEVPCASHAAQAERIAALEKLLHSGAWHRDNEGRTHLAIRMPDGADLSCYAMREDAINAAIAGKAGQS